jgi:hypothetical protein
MSPLIVKPIMKLLLKLLVVAPKTSWSSFISPGVMVVLVGVELELIRVDDVITFLD